MYIERKIKEGFKKRVKLYNIIALVGPRQAGKTTFLKNQIKNSKTNYLSFDDPDIKELFEEDVKKFEKQYLEGFEISILDEIQYAKNPGINLKYLCDKGKKLWLTSSSEIILSKEVLSYLVGRVSIIKLYPFSLKEFLSAKGIKEFAAKTLKRYLDEYIEFGGYPKVVLTESYDEKKILLKDLYETMVLKDVAHSFFIEDIASIQKLIKYLSINVGNLLSYESLSKTLNLSFQTIKKYLDALEKSYFIARIRPFMTNKSKEISKQPKFYFFDTGIRNAIINSFDIEPSGSLFENCVFSEIVKAGYEPKFWRTKAGAEVDFVIESGKNIIPIEAKVSAIQEHKRSLASFIKTYNPGKAIIVGYNIEEKIVNLNGCKIIYTNLINFNNHLKFVDKTPQEKI